MNNESTDLNKSEIAVPNQVRHENASGAISDNKGTIAKGGEATINDRTGLYIAIISLVFASLCLGLFLMQTILMPQIIDSKIAAGMAKAEEIAHAADTNARVALEHEVDLKVKQAALEERMKGKDNGR